MDWPRIRLRGARRHRQRGIALLMVLWVLILMGLIAASFLREARLGTNLARNTTENAKAEALAEAGVRRAMLGLIDPDPVTRWRTDGTPYRFALGEGSVTVRIQDERGKVDLNRAPPALLLGLFEAVGVDPERARSLVDAILDFRDADHERRPAGAEDPDYLAAGRAAGAKNARFESREELMQVLGMDREIYDAVAAYVTVHSRSRRVSLTTAPDLILRAVPDLAPEQLEEVKAERAGGGHMAQGDLATVRAEAVTRGGGVFVRETVLQRGLAGDAPFRILSWQQARRRAPPHGEAAQAPR